MWVVKTDFSSFLEMEKWEKHWRHDHGTRIVRVFLPNVPYALAYYDKSFLSDLYNQMMEETIDMKDMQEYVRTHDIDFDRDD